ncbi:MAG: metallophosphoesterase [Deltaproteobacteria bacterium]|nr:metallophosphoesterase [Deltaproteobacteria bacterium]
MTVEGPPAARAEIRRRLEQAGSVERAGPTVDGDASARFADPRAFLQAVRDGVVREAKLLWVEADGLDALDGWIQALRASRDSLDRDDAGLVFLAGPAGLWQHVARTAPDLASVLRSRIELPSEPQRLVTVDRPLCWLHLSDLHLQATDWRQSLVISQLVRDLPELLRERDLQPTLVFCTGDIASSGQPAEYLAASEAFAALLQALGVDPRQRLFLVPGNHDVDRKAIGRAGKALRNAYAGDAGTADLAEFDALLGDPTDVGVLGARLAAYCQFTSDMLGPARGVQHDRPWREDVVEIDGLRVGVASLCSVLLSGDDSDKGHLLLGERQVRQAGERLRDCMVRIALLHHPLSWLHESEQAVVEELLASEFHFVLHGHLHRERTLAQLCGGGVSVTSAAGALYQGGAGPQRVQVGRFEPSSGRLEIVYLGWSPRDGGYWHLDNSAGKAIRDGVQTLQLPAVTAGSAAPPAIEGLQDRLARAAVAVLEPFDFVGIPVAANRPAARLADVFVAQDFAPRVVLEEPKSARDDGATDGDSDWVRWERMQALGTARQTPQTTLAELERRLFADQTQAAHVVVLGGAGMGKSTLCRYLAHAAATRGKVPVLIRLRDYLLQRDGGLIGFACRQFRERYSVPVDEAALRALAEAGKVAVFIDGFDEVHVESQRSGIRDEVAALAAAWPAVAMLCTSRIVGYDRASLHEPFEHFELRPFDTERVRRFVERWYALAIANDPVERRRRTAELLQAIERTPAAADLASVPLLATLIALVHRYSAQLPGSRAKLLEKVVETLLETWPAAGGRVFRKLSVEKQRRLCEVLAWRVVGAREDREAAVTVSFDDAVQICAAELGGQAAAADVGARERLAQRWLEWMVEGAGLLVEASPGTLEFVHLSIAEYLAAHAWLTQNGELRVEALAAELIALAGNSPTRQIALYAAALECPRKPSLPSALVTQGCQKDDGASVWLLDLVLEGVIDDSGHVIPVVEAASRARAEFRLATADIFDAMAEHELPVWKAAVAPAIASLVMGEPLSNLVGQTMGLGSRGPAARFAGTCVAGRSDALQAAIQYAWALDWVLPTFRAASAAAMDSMAPAPNTPIYVIANPELLRGAPATAVLFALHGAVFVLELAILAATRSGGLARIGVPKPSVVRAYRPRALLSPAHALPTLPTETTDGEHVASSTISWASPSELFVVWEQQSPRPRNYGMKFVDTNRSYAWRRSNADNDGNDQPGSSSGHDLPTNDGSARSLISAFAILFDHGLSIRRRDNSWTPDEALARALHAMATTGTWPTPTGQEPTWPPELLAEWPFRYLHAMTRWLEAPDDPQRAADVSAAIDAYPGTDPDLQAILRGWRVVGAGSAEFDNLYAEMLQSARTRWPTIAANIDAWNPGIDDPAHAARIANAPEQTPDEKPASKPAKKRRRPRQS